MSLMSVAVREHLINTAFGLSALNGTDWKSPKKQKVDMSAQTYPGENQGNYVPPLPTVLQIALQPNPQRVWWVFQLTCLPCCIKPHRPPEAQGPTPRSAGSRPPRPHQNTALSNPEISCNAERAARDTWVRFQKYPHTHTHTHTHTHSHTFCWCYFLWRAADCALVRALPSLTSFRAVLMRTERARAPSTSRAGTGATAGQLWWDHKH